MTENAELLLDVEDLAISFKTRYGLKQAVHGIDLKLHRGEVIAIVGESGCGKSVTARAIAGLGTDGSVISRGAIRYRAEGDSSAAQALDITQMRRRDIQRRIAGREVGFIFQDAQSFLNPTMSIGKQIAEAARSHQQLTRAQAKQRALELLEQVGIADPEVRYNQYPHQFSGGMCQRANIAIAIASQPNILICDEPTTALDVTIQLRVLSLVADIVQEQQIGAIVITHDLGVVAALADYVCVMYAGRIVEQGPVKTIFTDPRHPYTWGLLGAVPGSHSTPGQRLMAIDGSPPSLLEDITGDPFAERNPYAMQIDFEQEAPLFDLGGGHKVASWLCHPDAPAVEVPQAVRDRIAEIAAFTEEVAR